MKKRPDAPLTEFCHGLQSVLDGATPCVGAHCDRVHLGKGIGHKAHWYQFPLTYEQHQYSHQHGELACFVKYYIRGDWNNNYRAPISHASHTDQQAVKEFFEAMAMWTRGRFVEAGGVIPEAA